MTALYEYADGGSFLEGNLFVEPLHGLTKLNADPSRPPELLLFGGDGSDSLFGVWLADTPHGAEVPIIEYDPGGSGLAVAGTSLTRFLTTRSAYYLMLYDEEDALDELGVPERLREHSQSLDDRTWEALARWADPELRLDWNNLYEPGITVEELRRVYGRS